MALLEPDEWSALERVGRRRGFPRGSLLMYEGEPGERVMILLTGRVKVTRAGDEGQQLLLSIRGPGEILGELSFLDAQPRLSTVTALEPVDALVVEADDFHRYLNDRPHVTLAILRTLSRRFRDAARKRSEFHTGDTVGRLASRLVELAERYGEPCEQGTVIALPLSQEELGEWVGASHAALAKALQTLRELGWIETARRRIIVCDLAALRARAA